MKYVKRHPTVKYFQRWDFSKYLTFLKMRTNANMISFFETSPFLDYIYAPIFRNLLRLPQTQCHCHCHQHRHCHRHHHHHHNHLKPIISPAPKLHDASLLIKGEVLDVHLARRVVNCRRFPLIMMIFIHLNFHWILSSEYHSPRQLRCEKVWLWLQGSPRNCHQRWKE